jgi:hypothetical protein
MKMGATIDNILDRLEQSSMFHLSLGSKELFHSNFLYWLSIVDWDAFITVMHGLADKNCFWWENKFKRSENREENEIEVRRESHNFDLSIYIRIGIEEDETDPSSVKGIWTPVFVLENKMKSLPRQDQLQEYTKKAFYDWKVKKKNNDIEQLWEQEPVSFVLLSLFFDKNFHPQCDFIYNYGRKNIKSVSVKAVWKRCNYRDLYDLLNIISLKDSSSLNQEILKDYCQFILALHELAEKDWSILPNDNFVKTIYPWALPGYHGDKQVELRIDDIRQKVHYAQMEAMLKEMLAEFGIDAVHASIDKNNEAKVIYNTNFAHNIGILEIAVRLDNNCAIFIQLQGHSYAHAFCYDKKDAAQELNKRRSRLECLFSFDELSTKITQDYKRITNNYPKELATNELYPKKWNSRAKGCLHDFKYFGKSFVYQNVLIPESVTIEQVLQAMVNDTLKCLKI